MAFPTETEANIRRRILDICNDHCRNVVEAVRQAVLMVDNYSKDDSSNELRSRYEELQKILSSSSKLKFSLMAEIASVGSLLLSREDFLRLMFKLDDLADTVEGFCYKFLRISERKVHLDLKYIQRLSELMGLVLKGALKVKETLQTLLYDPLKAMDLSKSVEDVERVVDKDSREMDLDLLSDNLPPQVMLLLIDLVERAERMSDLSADVTDQIRILALTS